MTAWIFEHPYTKKEIVLDEKFFIQEPKHLFDLWDYEEVETLKKFHSGFFFIFKQNPDIRKNINFIENKKNLEAAMEYFYSFVTDRYENGYSDYEISEDLELGNIGLKQLVREGRAVDKYASFSGDKCTEEENRLYFSFIRNFAAELRAKTIRLYGVLTMTMENIKYYKNLAIEDKDVTEDEKFIKDSLRNNTFIVKLKTY